MSKDLSKTTPLVTAICGCAVIASMRSKGVATEEIIAMAFIFGGLVLAALGDQRSSSALKWSGIGTMLIGLCIEAVDLFT